MALVKCPDCGKGVSDKAQVCPDCGYPIQDEVKRLEKVAWLDNLVETIETEGYDENNLIKLLKKNEDEKQIEKILSLIEKYNPDSYTPRIYRWAMGKTKSAKTRYNLFEKNRNYYLSDKPILANEKEVYPELDFLDTSEIAKSIFDNEFAVNFIHGKIMGNKEAIELYNKTLRFLKETQKSNSPYLVTFLDENKHENSIHIADLERNYKKSKKITKKEVVLDQAQITANFAKAIAAQGKITPTPYIPMSTGTSSLVGAIIGGTPGAIVGAAYGEEQQRKYKEALKEREALEKERFETMAKTEERPTKTITKTIELYCFEIKTLDGTILDFHIREDDVLFFMGKQIKTIELSLISNEHNEYCEKECEILREMRAKMKEIFFKTGNYQDAVAIEQEYLQQYGILDLHKIYKDRQDYDRAIGAMRGGKKYHWKENFVHAKEIFSQHSEWEDSERYILECDREIELLEQSQPSKPPAPAPTTSTSSSEGCYIATCVYGSYDCPEVWTLRRFRDCTLDETWYGRLFIKCYYAISPTLVKWFGEQNWFKSFWKQCLDKMVSNLNNKGVGNTQYNDKY